MSYTDETFQRVRAEAHERWADDVWDDDEPYADHEGDACTMCGGDGYDECDDPIQCCRRHTPGGLCPCGACGGSGLAKDQTIW